MSLAFISGLSLWLSWPIKCDKMMSYNSLVTSTFCSGREKAQITQSLQLTQSRPRTCKSLLSQLASSHRLQTYEQTLLKPHGDMPSQLSLAPIVSRENCEQTNTIVLSFYILG